MGVVIVATPIFASATRGRYRGYARDVINHVTPTLPLLWVAKTRGLNEWHAHMHALTSTAIGQKLMRTSVCSKQWAKAVALLAVRIDTLKALAYTSIVFLRKQREERDELLPWVVKTWHRTSTHGSVAFILYLEPRATIPYHPIMYHQCSVTPRAQWRGS